MNLSLSPNLRIIRFWGHFYRQTKLFEKSRFGTNLASQVSREMACGLLVPESGPLLLSTMNLQSTSLQPVRTPERGLWGSPAGGRRRCAVKVQAVQLVSPGCVSELY